MYSSDIFTPKTTDWTSKTEQSPAEAMKKRTGHWASHWGRESNGGLHL
jgi:hypothetical protein